MKKIWVCLLVVCMLLGNTFLFSACDRSCEHTYVSWIPTILATCGESGVMGHYECEQCYKILDEDRKECKISDLEIPATGKHQWDSQVLVKASANQAGTKKYTCSVCGETYQESYELTPLSSEEIYTLGEKSTVEITTYDKKNNGLALGTGFVISSNGQIITNFHVIDDAYSIEVKLGNTTYTVDSVVAYSEAIDLAIIKVSAQNLPALETCTDPQSGGATVYALGSSEGYTLSFSSGTIASPERVFDDVKYIQHNAAISHGNSGGPLFNAFGQVIGINTSTNPAGQNLNFAISVSEIDNLPKDGPFTMSQFYDKEGPYYEMWIGDYTIAERESNGTVSTAQSIYVNGTTVSGSVNKSTDLDVYKITIKPGERLTVVMAPEYKIDCDGIMCGLWNSSDDVIAAGTKTTLSDLTVNLLFYTNNTSYTMTVYYKTFYNTSYQYRNTVAYYDLFFYVK